ncbi:hypothetical protein BH09PAT4_BH09PAT4_04610 [soil metagenome]
MLFRQYKHNLKLVIVWLALIALPVASTHAVAQAAASKKATHKASHTVNKSKAKAKSKTIAKPKARTAAKCDTNYSGCVPVASDVDCKPGTGNGPAYISSVVRVLKKDIYRLDADHDGLACERN